jgi:hypothetical protein
LPSVGYPVTVAQREASCERRSDELPAPGSTLARDSIDEALKDISRTMRCS